MLRYIAFLALLLAGCARYDPEHVERITHGAEQWNRWRQENPLIKPNLAGAKFYKANFEGLNLSGADFSGAEAAYSSFNGANLEGAIFEKAYLQGASFNHANLAKSNFYRAFAYGTNFRSTNLTGAEFKRADLEMAGF
jgi:uncharacterized protein YjbI with pentapeptide repeats